MADIDALEAGWDAVIKESDFQMHPNSEDREGDYLGLYHPSKNTATTFLAPFGRGQGWRTLPKPVSGSKWEREPPREGTEAKFGFPVLDAKGRRIPALDAKRDDVMAQDIIDTDKHESGHEATHSEIEGLYDLSDLSHNQFTNTYEWGHDTTNDPLYPSRLQSRQERRVRENLPEDERWMQVNFPYESQAGFLLDNPNALRSWLKEGSLPNLMAFQNPSRSRDIRSAGHEMAAYTTEYPFHPGYVAGRWLHHPDVPQSAKRKYLQMVEREQKKAGVPEPISGKQIANQLSPKLGWGRRTKALRELMGEPPQNDEAPESKRLLMPPKARIQQNMINAAIGQAYNILAQAGDFNLNPITAREEQHGERVKMATQFAKPLIDAIKRHFKTNDGTLPQTSKKGKRLMDLPEDVRMELGRMQLRQHLANMVAQQNDLVRDEDFLTPKRMWDRERLESEMTPKIHEMVDRDFGGEQPRYARGGAYYDAEDIEAFENFEAKKEALYDEKIEELMATGEFAPFTTTGPFKENKYAYSEYPVESAIEIPAELHSAYQRWAERNGIGLHYNEGENYVKQKTAKQTVPNKRVPKNKAFYDPVTRAIADAFMQQELNVQGRSNFSPQGRKPGLQTTPKQDPAPKGKKWGGDLFSGEVGSEYGKKGFYKLGQDYINTTDRNPNTFEEWLNRGQERVPLNWLLGKVAQDRLNEIKDRKRKENDERIRREREARGED